MALCGILSFHAADMWRFGACGRYRWRQEPAGTVPVLPMQSIGKTPVARNAFKRSQKFLVFQGWNTGGFWLENGSKMDLVAGGRPLLMPRAWLGEAAARQTQRSPNAESRRLRLVKTRRVGSFRPRRRGFKWASEWTRKKGGEYWLTRPQGWVPSLFRSGHRKGGIKNGWNATVLWQRRATLGKVPTVAYDWHVTQPNRRCPPNSTAGDQGERNGAMNLRSELPV